MEKDPSSNIQLDQPRLLLRSGGKLGRSCFYAALMLLGALGGWGCLITAFQLTVYPVRLCIAAAVCCAFSVWRQVDERRRWWSVSLAGWLIWLLCVVFVFDTAAHGAVRTLNLMLESYGSKLNYALPSFTLAYTSPVGRPDAMGEITVFLSLLQLPFFWLMARMWIRSKNNRGPFGMTGILVLLPMSFSILPKGWAFAAVVLFWCVLLLMASSLSGYEGVVGGRRRYKASGTALARPKALALVLLLGLCMLGVYFIVPYDTYERPQLAESLRTGIRDGIGSSPYLRGGQGNSNKEVNLNRMGSRAYTGETMLRVKFDWQEGSETSSAVYRTVTRDDGEEITIKVEGVLDVQPANMYKEYLKSFVGSVYTGDRWERLPGEEREKLQKIELAVQNLPESFREQLFLSSRDPQGGYTLSVENLGANPRCVYIPSTLGTSFEELSAYGIEAVDDGYARSGNFVTGSREYELEAGGRTYGSSYFSRVMGALIGERDASFRIGGIGSSLLGDLRGNEAASFYFDDVPSTSVSQLVNDALDSINQQYDAGGPGWPLDLWKGSGTLWEDLSEERRTFLRAVEEYNEFVYEHYTQVPRELETLLEDFRKVYQLDPKGLIERGDGWVKDGVEYYAAKIAQAFQQYYTYTLDPPMPEEGEDFVEFFLRESREGYCVHFATAAVLLLRSAGYPARYAEGYAVPSGESGWVDIPDYNAHAWVEVYCGGTGWIPVEVTPASWDNPASYLDAVMPEHPEAVIATPQPEEARPTLPPRRERPELPDEEQPSGSPRASASPTPGPGGPGAGSGKNSFWPPLLWSLAGLALLAGVMLLNRLIRIRLRERELGQEDRNRAGLRAYAYLLRLYSWEAYCGRREDPPERWKELAEKARFSKHMLTEEELSELTADAKRIQEKLRRQLSRWQKLRCWLLGLI